jgi:hypothetical protein
MRSKRELLTDLPAPKEFDKLEEPKVFSLLYKLVWNILEVCLDVRSNTNPNKGKHIKKAKPEGSNPVIPKDLEIK